MPYLKCVPCRIRLDEAGPEADLFEGMCPICAIPLEPAVELAELVGFRSFDLSQANRSLEMPADARAFSNVRGRRSTTRFMIWADLLRSLVVGQHYVRNFVRCRPFPMMPCVRHANAFARRA